MGYKGIVSHKLLKWAWWTLVNHFDENLGTILVFCWNNLKIWSLAAAHSVKKNVVGLIVLSLYFHFFLGDLYDFSSIPSPAPLTPPTPLPTSLRMWRDIFCVMIVNPENYCWCISCYSSYDTFCRDLGSSNLSGHLVPELGKLEHLQYL